MPICLYNKGRLMIVVEIISVISIVLTIISVGALIWLIMDEKIKD